METKVMEMDDHTEAKRSRYHNDDEVKIISHIEDDYELELHQSGTLDDFEITNKEGNTKNEWEDEDDEENVKVEIRNQDDCRTALNGEPSFHAISRKSNGKHKSRASNEEVQVNDQQRMRLKRPFEGNVANFDRETDLSVISRRSKQIEYGKNTPEYFNYLQAVPRDTREPFHPKTPNKHRKYSRRAWDGMVRQWRINLHCWSDYPISATDQLSSNESDLEKLNESFTSEASGSTSTTSSVAAAFSANFGFLTSASKKNAGSTSQNASDSENEFNADRKNQMDSFISKRISRKDQVKTELEKTLLSTSWADEVEEYYDDDNNCCNDP